MSKTLQAPGVQEHCWAGLVGLFCPCRGQNCGVVVAAYPWTLGRLLALPIDFGQQVQPTPKAPNFRLVSQEWNLYL